jgi:hypothetical protein
MRSLKPATVETLTLVLSAIDHLTAARDHLRAAGCNNAADYVARALKSAHGAKNHARRRFAASPEGQAERAARALGWERGGDFGGFIFDAAEFGTWKAAASADDAPTYETWRECCEMEGIPHG